MHLPVAVGAERDKVSGRMGPALLKRDDMVKFEIRLPVVTREWRRQAAQLAEPVCVPPCMLTHLIMPGKVLSSFAFTGFCGFFRR